MNPLISIITPVIDGQNIEKYLSQAIQSLLSQDYLNYEQLFVLSPFSQRSLSLLKKYSDLRIKIILQDSDKGISSAINLAISKSKGEIISFLLADDYLNNPNILTQIIGDFENDKNLDVIHGNLNLVDRESDKIIYPNWKGYREGMGFGMSLNLPTFFIRKSVLGNNPFNVNISYADDYDLALRLMAQGCKFKHLNYAYVNFRRGGRSETVSKKVLRKEMSIIRQTYFKSPFRQIYYLYGLLFTILFRLEQKLMRRFKLKKIENMKIWIITVTDRHPIEEGVRKMRTPMLANSLVEAGHNLTWWTNSFCHFSKSQVRRESNDFYHQKIRYRFLRGLSYKKNISLRRYFHYKLMAWEFLFKIKGEEKPDIIVASLPDYDLPFAATKFALKNKIPILVDIRDLWPFEIKRQVFPFNRSWGKYLLGYEYFKVKYILKHATALTAVSERMLNWACFHRKKHDASKDRVFYLGHPGHEKSDFWVKNIKMEDEKVTFVYVGSFNNQHNLDLIIETAERLQQEHYDKCHFLLIGDGEHYQRIKKKAEYLSNVQLTGWQTSDKITQLLRLSDVGLVPIKEGDYFLPNKPFEYLSEGLPILSTLKGDMSEFVSSNNVGLTCSEQDSANFSIYVKKLTENPDLRNQFSTNAIDSFEKKYSSQVIYSRFVQYLEEYWGNKSTVLHPD